MNHYDVIVIGGGPSGCAAAISCARLGQKVLIVEATNALGGAMNNMLILPFMPYYTPLGKDPNKIMLSQGIFSEVVNRQLDMMKEFGDTRFATNPMCYFNDEYMKIILQRMALEANIDLLFHSKFVSCERKDNTIVSITVAAKSQLLTLTADYFIDCSGDAEVAYKAGFPTQLGRETDHLCQPMTMCFRIGDVDVKKFYSELPLIQKLYKEAKELGEIHNPREDVLVFEHVSPNILHFNTTRVVKHNPVDPISISSAEVEVREQVYEMFKFFKKKCPGCENATLLSTSQHIGVRESRMIVGEYVLKTEDLLNCTKFDDGIAACNYDIDIHNPEGSGTSHYYFPKYAYYTIPYRSLIPKDADNLLVAGRCISSTHEAQASYRVIPYVFALGEAAGVASALAAKAKTSVRKVDIDALLNQLRKEGAFVEKELDQPIPKENN